MIWHSGSRTEKKLKCQNQRKGRKKLKRNQYKVCTRVVCVCVCAQVNESKRPRNTLRVTQWTKTPQLHFHHEFLWWWGGSCLKYLAEPKVILKVF